MLLEIDFLFLLKVMDVITTYFLHLRNPDSWLRDIIVLIRQGTQMTEQDLYRILAYIVVVVCRGICTNHSEQTPITFTTRPKYKKKNIFLAVC